MSDKRMPRHLENIEVHHLSIEPGVYTFAPGIDNHIELVPETELRRLQAMEIRLTELLKNYGSPGLVGADTIRKAMKP